MGLGFRVRFRSVARFTYEAPCGGGGGYGISGFGKLTVEARKLEHGFRRISARIPYTLP